MKNVTVYLSDEEYMLLKKYILEKQLAGEKISLNKLITEAIKPLLNSLRNGNSSSSVSEESAQMNYTDNDNASENGEQEKTGDSSYTDSKESGNSFFFDGVDF